MSFQGTWLGQTSGDWFGPFLIGAGLTVVFFKRISKARTHSIHKPNYTITAIGDGTYNVVEYSGISQDKPNSVSYEGYEFP